MKKSLLTILSLAALAVSAQPVLNSANYMSPGTSLKMKTVSNLNLIDTTIKGANVVWDFSTLTNSPTVPDFVIQVVNPSSTPFGSQFPAANLAFKESPSTAYRYFAKTNTSIERVGSFTNVSKTYSDPQVEMIFPFTLGSYSFDSWANTSSSLGGTYEINCLGYGKLKLPGITFDTVFMASVIVDEVFELESYFWYDARNGMPVLQYIIGDGFFVGSSAMYTYSTNLTTGLNVPSPLFERISFNNPVSDLLTIDFTSTEKEFSYVIIDQLGREVGKDLASAGNTNSISVNMSTYSKGMYFIHVTGKTSGNSQTLKLIKQ